MGVHWRTARATTALISALGLAALGGSAAVAADEVEEEEGTKNLSVPVVLTDDDTKSSLFNETTVPELPTGTADYTNDNPGDEVPDGDYYTALGSDTYTSTVDTDFDADVWGADWLLEDEAPVGADVKWGDNLLSHVFPGTGGQPIRVEVNLFADDPTAFPEMLGYETVSLEGEMRGEVFGTLGVAEVMSPMVFTPGASLTILQGDPDTGYYDIVVVPEHEMGSEVNASGKLIYGFNWGTVSSVPNPSEGWYRLIFSAPEDSVVEFVDALAGEEEEGEEPHEVTVTAEEEEPAGISYIADAKTAVLDIHLGNPAPLPIPSESDYSGDGIADVLARDTAGQLWLYRGNGTGGWISPRMLVGIGWNGITAIVPAGDFSGDGYNDVLARDAVGRLWLYRGDGHGGWISPPLLVGTGWNGMTAIVAAGDFDGDWAGDVLARDTLGRLWLYPGDGAGGWLLPPVLVGTGWGAFTALLGVGDFSGDGAVDVLARDGSGRLWLYRGDGTGGWISPAVLVGTGWAGFTAIATPEDFSGDDAPDLLARDALGRMWLYRGTGTGGWISPALVVGTGWNSMTAVVS